MHILFIMKQFRYGRLIKRSVFSFAFLFVLSLSCSKTNWNTVTNSKNRSNDDSFFIECAIKAYDSFFPKSKVGAYDADYVTYIIENQDTVAVNVDMTDDGGFTLLGKSGIPLMVMSKGNLHTALDEIPAFRLTYQSLLEGANPQRQHPPLDTAYTEIVSTLLSDSVLVNISPLIEVDMHQGYPFNMYTPNGLAGCTPVSIAQAFSVFEKPNSIAVSFVGSLIDSTALSWPNMKEHLYYHSTSCDYCNMNGYLLREIGQRCSANYDSGATGAWPTISSINSFDYSAINGYSYNESNILASLSLGLPVIISGFNQANTVGHSWNIDGCYVVKSEYSVDTIQGHVILLHNWNEIHLKVYLHFNYGWGGYSNGYILARETITDVYDDGYEYQYSPTFIFSNDYPVVRRLVTHIKPNDYEYE